MLLGGHVFTSGGGQLRGGRNFVIKHWAGESSLRGPQVRNTRKCKCYTFHDALLLQVWGRGKGFEGGKLTAAANLEYEESCAWAGLGAIYRPTVSVTRGCQADTSWAPKKEFRVHTAAAAHMITNGYSIFASFTPGFGRLLSSTS